MRAVRPMACAQRSGHRRHLRLEGEPPEGGTVVRHQEPPALPRGVGVLGHARLMPVT